MPHQIDILHFDDELDSVDWFPRALVEACHERYPNSVVDLIAAEDPSELEMSQSFRILGTPENREVKISYHLIADEQRFQSHLKRTASDCICRLVILDLIQEGENGTLECRGSELWKQIREEYRISEKCILFVTAYPQRLREELNYAVIGESQVIAKPAPATRLTALLIERIEGLRSGALAQGVSVAARPEH